jgi:hypothetical protein
MIHCVRADKLREVSVLCIPSPLTPATLALWLNETGEKGGPVFGSTIGYPGFAYDLGRFWYVRLIKKF